MPVDHDRHIQEQPLLDEWVVIAIHRTVLAAFGHAEIKNGTDDISRGDVVRSHGHRGGHIFLGSDFQRVVADHHRNVMALHDASGKREILVLAPVNRAAASGFHDQQAIRSFHQAERDAMKG